MEEFMDLHIHTIYSDGDKTPSEIVKMSKEMGLTTIAITDHDIINGVKTLTDDELEGIELVSGVELSAKVEKGRMHILGYGIDLDNDYLNQKLDNRNDIYNLFLYVDYLDKLFKISFSKEEIDNITSRIGNVGRPELAKLLMDDGYVSSIDEAFTKYLNPALEACRNEKVGYTKEECIEMIREAGGIPVLAHPVSLKMDKDELIKEIEYLKDNGLGGIEVVHIYHDEEYRDMLREIALSHDLFVTGGTDYHGLVKPNVMLGTGINGNVRVTSSNLVDYLRSENKTKVKCKTMKRTNP